MKKVIPINGYKLAQLIEKQSLSRGDASEKIGYSRGYITKCVYKHTISEQAAELLRIMFKIKPEEYVIEEYTKERIEI